MFTLYHSNQLDLLKELLVNHIRQAPLAHPFEQEQVLVQSPGMAQWLKLELAKAFGIAANIEFPLPASFIWEMFTRVLADVPRQSPYNKGAMSWQLMTILPALLDRPAFAPLAAYLGGGYEQDPAGDPEQVRLWQLCQKVADLFDQYLVYRPDWIARWEEGEGLVGTESQDLAGVSGQDWQPELWRELVARTLALSPSGYHRANLYEEFIHELQRTRDLPGKLPQRVFVFGISALPPRYVEALLALGSRPEVEVHLFVTNPCRYYWGDLLDRKTLARLENKLKPGTDLDTLQGPANPLLASMGKLGRDYLHQLMELEVSQIEAFVDIDEVDASGNVRLLRAIQKDVLELGSRGEGQFDLDSSYHKSPIDPADGSLQIHACHGPMRELEVLHDRLLALFERDPSLTPKDVVVMMPDVNSYGPYIQAVFGARGQIPFAVSDRAASQESPLLQSFLALLHLPSARLGAGELLAILEVPAVLRRFELDDDEFNQLRVWVQETGIRWGLDDAYPERFELPRMSGNSWLFGLRRMLLGFAMGDGEPVAGMSFCADHGAGQQGAVASILPYAEIEGQQGLALGKLAWFVDSLAEFLPRLQREQSLPEWSACLLDLLDRFYLADEEEERLLQLIRSQLADWQTQLGEARFDQPITADLLQDYLGKVLGESRSSQRFLAGQVNFCTLMPMRSIPFKQVCLLGMNDGVYPRTLAPMGFDLMAVASRRGDRSRRDDDRYLFLEALLSAQQGLYISYQGFSAQDNSDKVPSVLLAELIDYVRQGFVLAGDERLDDEASGERLLKHLVVEHPLTPYSRSYFYPEAESRLFTYAADWLPALNPVRGAANFQSGELPLPPEWGREQGLELAELLRFYRQPAKYFLNRRLKVWFELNEANIEDSEPFELDGLQHYQLKALLLDSHLAEGDSAVRRERLQLTGLLPQGWFGSLLLDDLDAEMGKLAERLRPWVSEKQAVEIDISLAQGQLQGWIDTQKGRLLVVKPGSFNGKDLLLGWIQHLCLSLSCAPGDTLLFDAKQSLRLPKLSADEARPKLAALVALWAQGMKRPLPFFPNTAWDWLKAMEKEPDKPDAADKAALTRFNGGWMVTGEGQDVYVARCFPELDEAVLSQLQALAREHLPPLLKTLEELK
ncbi:exodeoxyribonuclease V subunit gamma [Aeromonas salmonicida subsp. salmonicida]|uniref:exodeoxyribonuclease V subunit gamma n=1 Tax=Aeromonas salmonicida TaxID=645 RepID=UPI00054244B6|nr:exodeoxyribonuclease V subunit gamma [Aeromonas salmonicida]ELI6445224.1 exodeoxyribonuclease V subunit gamma [Aeromonas salmonicida subsp. salmonicida]KHE98932.1 exodeoxyribonuclease V subunit gamma [Aeromonas salmonicida subsp. salmonicida]KHF00631.1 exodeoxyribonuclease V subunit gamma [Aeromonas salmonicida subsp. salmonicida]OKA86107.1 exodeoxyribonuclease V subunit gamma [Aeromonas salmonicida subsp. salmonicida]OKA88730.1 exodeoxyribonuclease V subunit gamma [Aeromonas salmonicida su